MADDDYLVGVLKKLKSRRQQRTSTRRKKRKWRDEDGYRLTLAPCATSTR